jgi:TPP-dependent pyruvate/acetoin dehydrogenase alpha subunit
MEGHAVHDDAFYVPREMHETWLRSDPIERFHSWLREHLDDFSEERDEESQVDGKRTLNEAMKRAEASPLPEPAEALDGVWAEPEELDTPHHK